MLAQPGSISSIFLLREKYMLLAIGEVALTSWPGVLIETGLLVLLIWLVTRFMRI